MTNRTVGKPPASTIALQFTPAQPAEAAEREKVTIEGSPERAGQAGAGKSSDGDAEALAILIAIDENEVHAAMAAQDTKAADAVLDYARMLHLAHGQSIAATQTLGLKLGINPLESAEVDRLHAKGAQDLAKLVPLSGEEFGRGFAAAMVSGHKDALATIDKLIGKAQNAAVKQHLTSARQHVAEHLKRAEALDRQS